MTKEPSAATAPLQAPAWGPGRARTVHMMILGSVLAILGPLGGFLAGSIIGIEPEMGGFDAMFLAMFAGLFVGGIGTVIAGVGLLRYAHRDAHTDSGPTPGPISGPVRTDQ